MAPLFMGAEHIRQLPALYLSANIVSFAQIECER